ncbi:MAG: HEAT repeat domain-containing protein, partial [Planctomycetes bacterium]|nr:HEAT repeat domain-containing protein [Planctomycetota bacterium]
MRRRGAAARLVAALLFFGPACGALPGPVRAADTPPQPPRAPVAAPALAAKVPDLDARRASPDATVRQALADELGALGDPAAFPLLAHLLGDPVPAVRAAAITALQLHPDGPAAARAELLARLADPDPDVARRALETLAPLRSPEVARAAVPLLAHADPNLRDAAARVIGSGKDPKQ